MKPERRFAWDRFTCPEAHLLGFDAGCSAPSAMQAWRLRKSRRTRDVHRGSAPRLSHLTFEPYLKGFCASDACVVVHPSDMAVALAALDATVRVGGQSGQVLRRM